MDEYNKKKKKFKFVNVQIESPARTLGEIDVSGTLDRIGRPKLENEAKEHARAVAAPSAASKHVSWKIHRRVMNIGGSPRRPRLGRKDSQRLSNDLEHKEG